VIMNLEIFVFISMNILAKLDIEIFVEFWIDSFLSLFMASDIFPIYEPLVSFIEF